VFISRLSATTREVETITDYVLDKPAAPFVRRATEQRNDNETAAL
jgi:hypothetical protein